MSRGARRAAALAVATALVGAALGCGSTGEGYGRVEGRFTVPGCTSGETTRFEPFAFTAQHVVTKRLVDHLEIVLLRYPVDLEETDGLVLQLESVRDVRAAWASSGSAGPLALPVRPGASPVRAALSLFSTCPRAPTLHVMTGTLTFARLALAADPADTGNDEVLTGVLTASVAGSDREVMAGALRAEFDFMPTNAPLLTPR